MVACFIFSAVTAAAWLAGSFTADLLLHCLCNHEEKGGELQEEEEEVEREAAINGKIKNQNKHLKAKQHKK